MTGKAIINPIKTKKSPDPGSVTILVSSELDMQLLCKTLKNCQKPVFKLMLSKVYKTNYNGIDFSFVGPIIGSSYAAMVLESIVAWGGKKFLFLGWCGSISQSINIGDIILVSSGLINEGTSRCYHDEKAEPVESLPCPVLNKKIRSFFKSQCINFHEGIVWTTDGIFRETQEKVIHYQKKGAIVVEMETSALFTVGDFRNISIGAILVVSDELYSLQWKPGFNKEIFKNSRKKIIEKLSDMISLLA